MQNKNGKEQMEDKRVCKDCGADISDRDKQAQYCKECLAQHHRDKNRRERAAIKETNALKAPKEKTKLTLEEKIAEAKRIVKAEIQKMTKRYCSAYDPTNIECVLCYENQTAAYKGCRK